MTYTVIIMFIDGSTKIIKKCTDYGLTKDFSTLYVEKNGYRHFFNKKEVRYIGREFDLKEEA